MFFAFWAHIHVVAFIVNILKMFLFLNQNASRQMMVKGTWKEIDIFT